MNAFLVPAWHEVHEKGFEVFTAEGLTIGSPNLMIVKTEEDALLLEKLVALYSEAGISIENGMAIYRFAYERVDHGNTPPRRRQNFEYRGVPRYEKLDEEGFLAYAREDIQDLLAREEQANAYNRSLIQIIEQKNEYAALEKRRKKAHYAHVLLQDWAGRLIGRLRKILA